MITWSQQLVTAHVRQPKSLKMRGRFQPALAHVVLQQTEHQIGAFKITYECLEEYRCTLPNLPLYKSLFCARAV